MRRLGVAVVLLFVVTSCTAGTDREHAEEVETNGPTWPPHDSRSSDDFEQIERVPCENALVGDGAHDGQAVIDDVVVLPSATDPIFPVVPVGDSGVAYSADYLPQPEEWSFAKHGLQVRANHQVEIAVAAESADDLRIGWGGSPSEPSSAIYVDGCGSGGELFTSEWLGFPGGYWVRGAGCYSLNLRIDDQDIQKVDVAIGATCGSSSNLG